MIPHKRSKNHRILTAEQKEHNHLINSTRVRVEHSIGRLKRYARLADPRPDPQLRIGPSMPIILQMCAPKHATFAWLCQKSCSYVPAC